MQPNHHPRGIGQSRQCSLDIDPPPAGINLHHRNLAQTVMSAVFKDLRLASTSIPATKRCQCLGDRNAPDPGAQRAIAPKPADAAHDLEKGLLQYLLGLFRRFTQTPRESVDRFGERAIQGLNRIQISSFGPGQKKVIDHGEKAVLSSHYLYKMHPARNWSQAPVVISKERIRALRRVSGAQRTAHVHDQEGGVRPPY